MRARLPTGCRALSRDIAAYGAHTLLDAIGGKDLTSYQDATAHLVPRASTAAPAR